MLTIDALQHVEEIANKAFFTHVDTLVAKAAKELKLLFFGGKSALILFFFVDRHLLSFLAFAVLCIVYLISNLLGEK